ncbi:MAG: hypothetical protein JWM27_244 [Gemmatimonadetes bacterium]|nr:hypothetical protein [Gemmatimonadota bacterium]
MQIALIAAVAIVLGLVARRLLTPRCPRCRARNWDRKLCQPLLFCRSCATRCDSAMRVYN